MFEEHNQNDKILKVSSTVKYGDLEDTIKIPITKANQLEDTQEFNFGLETEGGLNDN